MVFLIGREHECECFVHGEDHAAVPANTLFVADGFSDSLAHYQAEILHGMVVIDVDIALDIAFQVKQSVLREEFEHV